MSMIKTKQLLVTINTHKLFIRTFAASTNVKPEADTEKLKSWKEIPGLPTIPVFGAMYNFFPIIGSIGPIVDFHRVSEIVYERYGPLVRFEPGFGTPPSILIYDVDCIEQVLRTENTRNPERPGFPSLEYYRKSTNGVTKSTGLLTEDGEFWKTFRSLVNPVLLQPKTVKLYSEEIDNVSQDMITRLKSIRDDKNMIAEFEIEMNKWALESIGVVALGGRIGCISNDLPEDSLARQLIQCVRDVFEIADKLDNKPGFWKYFPTPMFKKAMKVYENHHRITEIFIKKAMEEYKKRDTPPENKGVLEKLLEVDENVALVMAEDMLFAGVDTTSTTMIAALHLLGVNPEKQQELRKEILSTNHNDRRPYLKACIKETLRLFPVAGANLRRATKEYNLMGYSIPIGMHLITMHEYMSKMESQYPEAHKFIPERWIVNKDDKLYHGNAHPLTTSPFGFGVRSCIGRRIAELEMETFLARLIENFDVEWFGSKTLSRKSAPINYILGPYDFIFKDVKKS